MKEKQSMSDTQRDSKICRLQYSYLRSVSSGTWHWWIRQWDIYSLLTRLLIHSLIYLCHEGLEGSPFLCSPSDMQSVLRNLAKNYPSVVGKMASSSATLKNSHLCKSWWLGESLFWRQDVAPGTLLPLLWPLNVLWLKVGPLRKIGIVRCRGKLNRWGFHSSGPAIKPSKLWPDSWLFPVETLIKWCWIWELNVETVFYYTGLCCWKK